MGLESGKHIEKEIDGALYRIVESGISDKRRIEFLTTILEHNGYDVKWSEEVRKIEEDPITYMLGVTDLTFNAVLAVYGRRLRSLDGHRITPEYWLEKGDSFSPVYWENK